MKKSHSNMTLYFLIKYFKLCMEWCYTLWFV